MEFKTFSFSNQAPEEKPYIPRTLSDVLPGGKKDAAEDLYNSSMSSFKGNTIPSAHSESPYDQPRLFERRQ